MLLTLVLHQHLKYSDYMNYFIKPIKIIRNILRLNKNSNNINILSFALFFFKYKYRTINSDGH